MFQIYNSLRSLKWFARDEKGQGMVEYALIIGLIAVALILVLGQVEGGITGVFTTIVTKLQGVGSGS